MTDYITLLGAEDVSRAASTMSEAADNMYRAASLISETMERSMTRLEHVTDRLAEIHRKTEQRHRDKI